MNRKNSPETPEQFPLDFNQSLPGEVSEASVENNPITVKKISTLSGEVTVETGPTSTTWDGLAEQDKPSPYARIPVKPTKNRTSKGRNKP